MRSVTLEVLGDVDEDVTQQVRNFIRATPFGCWVERRVAHQLKFSSQAVVGRVGPAVFSILNERLEEGST